MRLALPVLAAALGACSGGGAQRPAARNDDSAPVTAAPGGAADDWSTFAHDQLRSGFQPQPAGIAKASVGRLALRWRYQTGDGLQASPLVAGGRVYVASQRGDVRALDARSGRLLWQTSTGATIAMTPALADGLLFVGDHRAPGAFMALDAASGKRLWQTLFAGGVRSEPVIANGVVYEGETGGDGPACHHAALHALGERTGVERWRWYVDLHEHEGGSIWSPLSYDAGRVLFGTGNACESGIDTANAIVAVDRSGQGLWAVSTADSIADSDVGGGTLVLHGQAIVSAKNGNLYDVDEASGRVNWTTALGGVPGYGGFGTATTDGKTIVASAGFTSDPTKAAGPPGGALVGLDRGGRILWRVRTANPIDGAAAITNGIAFTPLDAAFVALDLRTGAKLWSYPAGQTSYPSPAVVPSGVYFANNGGEVFAFDIPEKHR
jgi:outer membrane protein assembly factor BamB